MSAAAVNNQPVNSYSLFPEHSFDEWLHGVLFKEQKLNILCLNQKRVRFMSTLFSAEEGMPKIGWRYGYGTCSLGRLRTSASEELPDSAIATRRNLYSSGGHRSRSRSESNLFYFIACKPRESKSLASSCFLDRSTQSDIVVSALKLLSFLPGINQHGMESSVTPASSFLGIWGRRMPRRFSLVGLPPFFVKGGGV